MQYGLENSQIANALNLPDRTISDTIYRYRLPRDEVINIPSKSRNDVVGS